MTDRKRRIDLGGGGGDILGGKKGKSTTAGIGSSSNDDDGSINPWTGIPFSARYHSILAVRQKLPVYQFKDQLIECVQQNQIVVVEGETGSGYVFMNIFVVMCAF